MQRTVVWKRLDTPGLEYAEILLRPLSIVGEIVVVEASVPLSVSYRVTYDTRGATDRAAIRVRHAGAVVEHVLARSPEGCWAFDAAPQPTLDGLVDVDVSVTPSTNTAPLRRLQLGVGQRAEVTAAWVQVPSFALAPLRQVYRRATPSTYEYEAPDLGFRAVLECDEDGIVRTYGGLWAGV